MCLRVRNRTHVVRVVASHHSSVVLNPPSGVRPRFLCTDPPYAQSRARAPLPVPYVPTTWQVGDSLSEAEALDVSLLNFIYKADFVEWLCPVVESTVPPTLAQLLLQEFVDVFTLKLPPGLPVNRVTDHRIDLIPDSKPPAHRLYRMSRKKSRSLKLSWINIWLMATSNPHAVLMGLVFFC